MATFRFRIFPKKSQSNELSRWIEECRLLYNSLLAERKDLWQSKGRTIHLFEQSSKIVSLRKRFPKVEAVYSKALYGVGARVDYVFREFVERVENGEKPGQPRFKNENQYDTIYFPSDSLHFKDKKIKLPKIGYVKVARNYQIFGKIQNVTLKRSKLNEWTIIIKTDYKKVNRLPKTNASIGIDVGIVNLVALSDGQKLENPQFHKSKEKQLSRAHRKFSELKTKKAQRVIEKIHKKIKNKQKDFLFKVCQYVVEHYDTICIEDLNFGSMLQKGWFRKQIMNAGVDQFVKILIYKAGCAGRKLIKVNPAYTSQNCSCCKKRTRTKLSQRTFHCSHCGYKEDRDINASRNILALGLQSLGNS